MPDDQVQTEQQQETQTEEVLAPEKLDESQLDEAIDNLDVSFDQMALEEPEITFNISDEGNIPANQPNTDQGEAPGTVAENAQEVQAVPEESSDEGETPSSGNSPWWEKTPFNKNTTREEMAAGYHQQRATIDKLGQRIGELRNEVAQNSNQPAQTTLDPYDDNYQKNLDNIINQRVAQAVEQKISPIVREQKLAGFKREASLLAEDHPEYKLNDSLDNIVAKILEARQTGVDPVTLHEEAPKVMALDRLVNIVQQNPMINTMKKAHQFMEMETGKLDEKIVAERRKATIDTVQQIKTNSKGAKTIAKVPGKRQAPLKLSQLSNSQFESVMDQLSDAMDE